MDKRKNAKPDPHPRKASLTQVILWMVLLAALTVFAIPYLFMISNSLMRFTYSLPYPPRLLPDVVSLDAYVYILTKKNILLPFLNSVFIACSATVAGMLVSSLSAYAFARIPFIGRRPLFRLYLFTLMIPGVLNIVPQFLLLKGLTLPGFPEGLTGTRLGLILLYVGTGVCGNTFFLRGFFASLPNELEESVVLDGGGHGTIFFHVMLPLSKPALGTLAIFSLQGYWEEFFSAKVVLGGNERMLTMPIILQRLHGEHATRWEWVFAASILMQVPILLLFVVFQKKYVVGGLSDGAVKG